MAGVRFPVVDISYREYARTSFMTNIITNRCLGFAAVAAAADIIICPRF